MPPAAIVERAEARAGLVHAILQREPGLTAWEIQWRLARAEGKPRGQTSDPKKALRRLESAGRAERIREPHACKAGFRDLWYPAAREVTADE
jgi:hypothetical protein